VNEHADSASPFQEKVGTTIEWRGICLAMFSLASCCAFELFAQALAQFSCSLRFLSCFALRANFEMLLMQRCKQQKDSVPPGAWSVPTQSVDYLIVCPLL